VGERREAVSALHDEDLIEVFSRRLPDLLERRPDLEPVIFKAFLKAFARREEVALVLTELRALRTEMERRFEQVDQRFEQVDQRFEQVDQRFEQVDQRFEQVDQRLEQSDRQMHEFRADVAARFEDVQRAIDRLGSRWGIRNESLFRQTIAALLEQSFGVSVEQRTIAGEQFDILIHGREHILVEIAASVGRTIQTRLERKRRLYEESTGVSPARVILATASIHSRRAQELRENGIEVVEPEETEGPEL
jgi:hypothetical protein